MICATVSLRFLIRRDTPAPAQRSTGCKHQSEGDDAAHSDPVSTQGVRQCIGIAENRGEAEFAIRLIRQTEWLSSHRNFLIDAFYQGTVDTPATSLPPDRQLSEALPDDVVTDHFEEITCCADGAFGSAAVGASSE